MLLAGLALTSSAVIILAVMIIGYLVVTHAFAPRRLKYSMPVNLNLNGNDLLSNISLHSLEQYLEDGQVRDVFLLSESGDIERQKPLLIPGQVTDFWIEIKIPPEYEKLHPERKYAHVTSTLSTHGGMVVARMSKPIYLNGRPRSAFNLILSPWRWIGVFNWHHTVSVPLHLGFNEKRGLPSVFLATEIKARSAPGPEILDVSVHVAIRAGIIRKILFYARPQSLAGKSLGFGSMVAILAGVGTILWCFQAYYIVPDSEDQSDIDQDISSHPSETDSRLSNSDEIISTELVIKETKVEKGSDSGQSIRKRR